jgi:hypothetical protein
MLYFHLRCSEHVYIQSRNLVLEANSGNSIGVRKLPRNESHQRHFSYITLITPYSHINNLKYTQLSYESQRQSERGAKNRN